MRHVVIADQLADQREMRAYFDVSLHGTGV